MARIIIYRTCPTATIQTAYEVAWDTVAREQIRTPAGAVCSPYNIGQNVLLDSWCEGTTLNEVFSVWNGSGRPPREGYTIRVTENAPACFVQNPCGLSVLDTLVEETAPGVFQATVIASDINNVEYSLNNFATVQDSNVFPNLTPGNYTAYVRKKR